MAESIREELIQEGSMRARVHEANPVPSDLSREIDATAEKVFEAGVDEDDRFHPPY